MDNNRQIIEICARIKDLREFNDYSLEDFAKKIGMDEGEYLAYESGEKDIPIGMLYSISSALDIDIDFLLSGKNSSARFATVVTDGNGTKVERYPGYSFTSLAASFMSRTLEPMLVTINEGVTPEPVQHYGQEFNYVLKGALRVIIREREYYLKAGDSIYFDATLPHAQVSMDKTTKFLTIIQIENN